MQTSPQLIILSDAMASVFCVFMRCQIFSHRCWPEFQEVQATLRRELCVTRSALKKCQEKRINIVSGITCRGPIECSEHDSQLPEELFKMSK